MIMTKILITGHPRSGTGYCAKLFQAFGLDVQHELETGEDGISSWIMIQDVIPYPWGPEKIDYTHMIHVVRDPIEAIPSIMAENNPWNSDWHQASYNYRKEIIKHYYGINIGYYSSEEDKAAISYLLLNRLVKNAHLTIRVEDCVQTVSNFVWNLCRKSLSSDLPPTNYNTRPKPKADWSNMDPDLLEELDRFCEKYGYPTVSSRIGQGNV